MSSYTVVRDVEIAARDGVVLRADLWRPASEEPLPAIVFRTPYDKRYAPAEYFGPQQAVEAGFAVVVQDTRGRYASDGEWRPWMWDQEGRDSYDTVEWVAAQPWCNGEVGMAGQSYLGVTQLAAARQRPPHLKAIAPAITLTAEGERAETGGAFWLENLFGWLAVMAVEWANKRKARGLPLRPHEEAIVTRAITDPRWLMDARPLRSAALFDLPDFPVTFDELVARAVGPEIDFDEIAIPILACGGWYDLCVRSTLAAGRRGADGAEGRHVVVGCWSHGRTTPYVGQLNYGVLAGGGGAGLAQLHVQFFRKYLQGGREALPRYRFFLMNGRQWRDSDEWPPKEAHTRRLFLECDGEERGALRASAAEPGGRESRSFSYDPSDPTPTVGGRLLSPGDTLAGPIDQRHLGERADVICYDGEPASGCIDIIGPVIASLFVSTDAVDTDFVAKLVDLAPTGIALPIVEGVVRLRSLDREPDAGPRARDEVSQVRVDLGPTAWRVLKGHRLRLQVQSANYPHLDPNMNTGRETGDDTCGVVATNTVWHGPERGSWVEFQSAPPTRSTEKGA